METDVETDAVNERRPWRQLRHPTDVVDALCELYAERGDERYDEAVSQAVHGVQSALLAEEEGAAPALVVAALLHDVGHLLERGLGAGGSDRDLHHEEVAARFLANWFGPDVTEPIRHHVAAKRFLCTVEPDYRSTLSPASAHSLALQGGIMSPDEVVAFLQVPGGPDAIRLRRWDDLAKNPDRPTPRFDRYRELLIDVVAD